MDDDFDDIGDRPLQLAEVVDKKLQLNQENLNHVLRQTKDLPLSVLSICGPVRQGKSFLQNYLVRYLEALENDEVDWLDSDNPRRPLQGFRYGSGAPPITQGIWIWSRPFIIVNEENEKIAVLLIDTQGTSTEFTSTTDHSLVGLTLLTSSVVIFNFFDNLQENIIAALHTYTQYGLLALKQSDEDDPFTPFQTLIFLIRDWNNPGQFSCGSQGGKSFLNSKLKSQDALSKESQQVRQSIKKCFKKLDCFLLPPIGDKALSPDFTGSIQELNVPFTKSLSKFIENVIDGKNLPIKTLLGSSIEASEFKSGVEKYIKIFNSDQVPSAETMWLTTTQLVNNSAIEKSMKKYTNHMNMIPTGHIYFSSYKLTTKNNAGKKQALEVFKNANKVGSTNQIKELKEKLEKELKIKYADVIKQNEDKRKTYIAEVINELTTDFREELETKLPFGDPENPNFYDPSLINRSATSIQSAILDNIEEERFPNDPQDEQESITQSIKENFSSILDSYLAKNKQHRVNAEHTLQTIVKQQLSNFQFKAEEYFSCNKFEDNDATFNQAFNTFSTTQIRAFEQQKKPGKKEFINEYFNRLKTEMERIFNKLRNEHKLHIQHLLREHDTSLNDKLSQYESELRGMAQGGEMNISALRFLHGVKAESMLDKFENYNPFPIGSATRKDMENRLKQRLQQVLDNVLNKRVSDDRHKTVMVHGLEFYDKNMEDYLKSFDFTTTENLQKKHDTIAEKSVENYEQFLKTSGLTNTGEVKADLKTKIQERFLTHLKNNEQRRELATGKLKTIVKSCEEEYDQTMQKQIDTCRSEKELQASHEMGRTIAFNHLKDACSASWDLSFIQQFEEMLELDIEEMYNELNKGLVTKIAERKIALERILGPAQQHYDEEMKKHFAGDKLMTATELLDIHEKVKSVVIAKCHKTKALTEFQKEDLGLSLNALVKPFMQQSFLNANNEAPAIGIDLGTTYCCVAVYYRGKVHIIPNQDQGGDETTPSYVSYDPSDGSVTYGKTAKDNAYKNPENTIYDAKRILGRQFDDKDLQDDMKFWPFTVKPDPETGVPQILVNGTLINPEQVSARLLTEFKIMAEKFLKLEPGKITKAVITVPAYFNDGQRQATVDAGEGAGLEVLTILNEPTAAAISYSLERLTNEARKILVYDLGGGTFDVAVLDMKDKNIDVLGVSGDTHLGGEDFDKKMMEYCTACFKTETGIDLCAGKDSEVKQTRDEARRRLRRLQTYCERAKIDLASARRTKVSVDALAGAKDLTVDISRTKFEELNMKYFEKSITLVNDTLEEKGIKKEEIDDIVLVGGSSRIPKVQELLMKYFDGKALNRSIHPDHAVAYGAAVQAALMNGEQAMGGINLKQIRDVTPMSMGVEIVTKELSVILPKNSKIPAKRKEEYFTCRDNQTSIEVKIFQGENLKTAANNKLLGTFTLTSIPPKKAGAEPIDIWMEIDAMGILHVKAVCRSNKSSNSIEVVEEKFRMSKEAKKKMLEEMTKVANTHSTRHGDHRSSRHSERNLLGEATQENAGEDSE